MTFLIFTIAPLLLSSLVAGNFSYDGTNGPAQWGKEYQTCLGKFQSPIDIEEQNVTIHTFPPLQFSSVQRSHTAYMKNNGHTVMIQSFDDDLPTVSGGPLNSTYVFQQLHFHWGQNDNVGSEDLINNRPFSMELHAVFWNKEYGSPDKAMNHSDGLTVLAYLFEVTNNSNPTFESIVSQIPEVTTVDSNVSLKDATVLSKLIAPNAKAPQDYFTYRGSLTTPPCLEIVQWIDFIQPQFISHEQLAAFRSIQSSDGTNLTHNFRPVQPLDGRKVYRNSVTGTSNSTNAPAAPETTTAPPVTTTTTKKPELTVISSTVAPLNVNSKNESSYSGQQSMWTVSPFVVMLGLIFLLPFQ